MLGDDELIAIGVTGLLWLSTVAALVFRRHRTAAVLALVATAATLATLVFLRAGTGHRA